MFSAPYSGKMCERLQKTCRRAPSEKSPPSPRPSPPGPQEREKRKPPRSFGFFGKVEDGGHIAAEQLTRFGFSERPVVTVRDHDGGYATLEFRESDLHR